MARVQFGAIVTGLRGKVGGSVFSNNSSGPTYGIKTTAKKAKPKGIRVANNMGGIAKRWRALSASDRSSFNSIRTSYPRTNSLGQTYYLSGFQLFCAWAGNLIDVGAGELNSFIDPTLPDNNPNANTISSITFSIASGITINHLTSGINTATALKVFVSAGVSVGKNTISGAYKFLTVETDATDPITASTSSYNTLFRTPSIGQAVFFKIKAVSENSGLASIVTDDYKVIVTA